ncbi:MAG: 23S rRNA (pseudouridine(1915)-N(3))-methyltransferase RlmH [Saprospiraceae bacterium]|nr:23S rRNA (pseudouridine(1915)-N(3))-methyltransferase RlmH [Saprospiraceae bacterium]
MEFQLWWTGKTAFKYLEDGIHDYKSRVGKMCRFTIHEFKGTKSIKNPELIMEMEENDMYKKLQKNDYVILLDEKGKKFTSQNFATEISRLQTLSNPRVTFVIGGAYGFSEKFKKNANYLLSFSDFTMSHQLIRLVFMEQLYRAFTIINNKPYHND